MILHKRVLVTGGAGFVGRHFISSLLERDFAVTCVDNLVDGGGGEEPSDKWPTGDPRLDRRFEWLPQDCRSFFDSAESRREWDLVLHLAAVVGGRQSIELRPLAVAEDLEIDSAFWRWAKAVKPHSIVHFSSSAAYPVSLQSATSHRRLREDDIQLNGPALGLPDLTYGWAKLTSEYLASYLVEQGVHVVTYRPFSGYGPDQDLSYPFPSIAKRAVETQRNSAREMFVWGSGDQVRDFIHIGDIVDFILDRHLSLPSGLSLNLGTGYGTSFKELAAKALQILGSSAAVTTEPKKPEGVFYRVADPTLAEQFGFSPKIDLSKGLESSLTYWLEERGRA